MKLKIHTLFLVCTFLCILINTSFVSAKKHESININLPDGLTTQEWHSIKGQVNEKNHESYSAIESKSINDSGSQQTSYLKASNAEAEDLFGYSVAISGDTLVVSAVEEASAAKGINGNGLNNSADNAGAVYVFIKVEGTWQQQAYLKASNTDSGDLFGFDVAIDGNTIVVSALYERSNAAGINGDQSINVELRRYGAVYVFVRENSLWSQQAYIKASNPGDDDRFGASVAISNNTIVVGAYFESSNATGVNGDQNNNSAIGAGAAYVFSRTDGTWVQSAYLKASNTGSGVNDNLFGFSVDIDEDTIVVGAYREDSNSTGVNNNQNNSLSEDSGAVYVFNRTGDDWTQQAYLKASNTGSDDYFGRHVNISGNTIAVSAFGEDSDSVGINGEQDNNMAENSGAVYVFTEVDDVWSQQAYIKASNSQANDIFGRSTSIDNDILVVGADSEDSNSVGINGDQSNNSLENSGAVYVFQRSNGVWMQNDYLKVQTPGEGDYFGDPVAIDGNTIAIGAWLEDSNATEVDGNQLNNSAEDSGAAYVFELGQGFDLQAGHSALWYNPEQSGHGINVYMLADNRILVFWYVYDDQGNQVWLLGVGTHDGTKATLDVTFNDGAMFPPNFDSADVNTASWGQFELEFSDCNAGLFKWIPLAGNGFTAGETNVTRLTSSLGLTCSESSPVKTAEVVNLEKPSLKAGDFALQAAHSALWYNPEQSGHGINVYMLADNRILLFWYVYDDLGNQVWLLGVGTHDGIKATLDVTVTSGAMFPPNFNAGDVNSENWGQFELEFSGCNNGLFKWLPVAGNGYTAGETNVVRLNATLGLTCTE